MPDSTDQTELHIDGISLISFKQVGPQKLWRFKVVRGHEDAAVAGLVAALDLFNSVSLADHSRGDDDSMATYEQTNTGFRVMVGGHGWSGDWIELDSAEIIPHMRKRIKYNYGNHPSETGSLSQIE